MQSSVLHQAQMQQYERREEQWRDQNRALAQVRRAAGVDGAALAPLRWLDMTDCLSPFCFSLPSAC